jgi:hypothetical protein
MILAERGNHELTSKGRFEQFGWSVVDIDFHESFLSWHNATWFCRVGQTKSFDIVMRASVHSFLSEYPLILMIRSTVFGPIHILAASLIYKKHTFVEPGLKNTQNSSWMHKL